MLGKQDFSFSRGTSKTTGAGAEVRTEAQTSRTVLKIRYKSSLQYLGTLVAAAGASATEDFISKGPTGWLDNLSFDWKGGKESGGAIEGAMEGVIEGRSRQGCLRSWIEVILVQTFF